MQRHSVLYQRAGSTIGQERSTGRRYCIKLKSALISGIQSVLGTQQVWLTTNRGLSQNGTVEQCSHVMVQCSTRSTTTFGTVRIYKLTESHWWCCPSMQVCMYLQWCTCEWVTMHVCEREWVVLSCFDNDIDIYALSGWSLEILPLTSLLHWKQC